MTTTIQPYHSSFTVILLIHISLRYRCAFRSPQKKNRFRIYFVSRKQRLGLLFIYLRIGINVFTDMLPVLFWQGVGLLAAKQPVESVHAHLSIDWLLVILFAKVDKKN